jgi:hypothetical protein
VKEEYVVAISADAQVSHAVATEEAPMVLLASTYDQSKFFKAADLEKDRKLRIKSVTEEQNRKNGGELCSQRLVTVCL